MIKFSRFLHNHKIIKYFILFTWGLPASLIGLLIFIAYLVTGHRPHIYKGELLFVSRSNGGWGLECGWFYILTSDCVRNGVPRKSMAAHESGHIYQNAIFGPLYLFLVGIPSMIRFWYRELRYYKRGKEPKTDYYAIWFEKQANILGEVDFI